MAVYYKLRQSTDEDAFDPYPFALPHPVASACLPRSTPLADASVSQNTAFTAGPAEDSVKIYMSTRKQVLDDVRADQKSKDRKVRLKGRVGIITGVGPEMGIGVSESVLVACVKGFLVDIGG